MAKRKPQTRFVVEIGGELKRLFSIREVGNGGLLITTHTAGAFEVPSGVITTVKECRHSVHPSAASATAATTIHRTCVFSNGERFDLHLLTHSVRDKRYQPIQVRKVFDLSDKPALVAHPRDTVIALPDYDPKITTLLYSIWLCPTEMAKDYPIVPGYSCAAVSFDRFGICVPFSYLDTPSTQIGSYKEYATSSEERITPQQTALGLIAGIAEGASIEETPLAVVRDFNQMAEPKDPVFRMTPRPPSPPLMPEAPKFWPVPKNNSVG